MDFGSVIGLVACLFIMFFGIIYGKSPSVITRYLDVPSFIITFGGSFCSVLISCTLKEFAEGVKSFLLIFKPPVTNTPDMIQDIISLSNVARKEGLLSLEEATSELEDDFLRKGILLIVDGIDPELVRTIMETELDNLDVRHKIKIGFWEKVGTMGPAWGMIGTLIGLINMLRDMDDPGLIGPSMAVALITTFYGAILANWICTPVANKLRTYNNMEIASKEIMLEGLLSIQSGENPRVIEEKLKSYLTPSERRVESEESEDFYA